MKHIRPSRWGAILAATILLAGCTVNRDIMFKTPTDYKFAVLEDSAASRNLLLQPNDVLQFRLFANDGFKMIDLVSDNSVRDAAFYNRMVFLYTIESDGLVKMPLLGRIKLAGMTLRQAETFLQEQYTTYYNRPFAQIQVVNRRVVVFPGDGGDARIVQLENNNTTLLEALAQAGGLAKRGDARRVKLFRQNNDGTRSVHQFDLSVIEGLKRADIVLQGDDVIYVQPNPELAREVLQDLTPIITLLTSLVLVIGVVRGFSK